MKKTAKRQPIVCVTGASSGIGAVTVKTLLNAGWGVCAVALPDKDWETGEDDNLLTIGADITQTDSIAMIYEQLVQKWGRLDALINNAGINRVGVLETLSNDDLQAQFAVNVTAPLQMIQTFLPLLRHSQGRILNISSLMGQVAMPTLGAYSMSKHALEAMTDVLRIELAPLSIQISTVAFGAINTPMTASMGDTLAHTKSRTHQDVGDLYDGIYESMEKSLQTQAGQAIPPEKVANVIMKALNSKRMKTSYVVDFPTRALFFMRHLAPAEIRDKILARALNIKN